MKKSNELVVHLTNDFGAMSRLMNMLRRRGFCIENLNAKRMDDGGYQVEIRLENESEGTREVELLVKQVGNLIDVRSVCLDNEEEDSTSDPESEISLAACV